MNSAFFQSCLAQYSDVLRPGRMTLNGVWLEWDPPSRGSIEHSLVSFADALCSSGKVPKDWVADVDELTYCILKSLSFQFALMDVLEALKEEFRLVLCPTIPTSGMQYAVALSEVECLSQVLWPADSKIFTADPDSDIKRYYATIAALRTSFAFPAKPGVPQKYRVEMRAPQRVWCCFTRNARLSIGLTACGALFPREALDVPELPQVSDKPRTSCSQGCRRIAARGRPTCCRTCVLSQGARHGQRCGERTACAAGASKSRCDRSEECSESPQDQKVGTKARAQSDAAHSDANGSTLAPSESEDEFDEHFPLTFEVEVVDGLHPSTRC